MNKPSIAIPEASSSGPEPSPSTAVLIVDDNNALRETLAELLEGTGYGVACAANGRQALDYLRTGGLPGLILLDVRMPVMNGWKLLKVLEADPALRRIPVVV